MVASCLRGGCAVVVGLVLALAGCGGGGPRLLLLPAGGGDLPAADAAAVADAVADPSGLPADVRTAAVVDAVPDDDGSCGVDQQSRWLEVPVDSPVVELPGVGYTMTRTGPQEVDGDQIALTVVCDFDASGELLVADELTGTGTDQVVANDYVTRTGTAVGRVDIGIPTDAVTAVQAFEGWALFIPLPADLRTLRLHALEGGSEDEGFEIGTVSFHDADGVDITAEALPSPDVVHGVPRSRGSGVGE